jgi:epoxyqueuosine reductase
VKADATPAPSAASGAELRDFAVDTGLRLGFAAVGVARVGKSTGYPEFERWLAAGCAADMDYLHRHRALRRDPCALLPEAQSVICVAARYPVNPHPGAGFSTYARGRDYHEVIRRKLRQLAGALAGRLPALRTRICVDSAPLLEREWAARAGIGWPGRQGQIVSPTHGACLLLGELLVSAELPPSEPVASRCGDCRRCVDACPTGAIGADGRVDARRCIAYLTIEHAGPIPPELAGRVSPALFGCDRCTAVCPWNPADPGSVMPELQPETMPDASEILAMDADAFQRRFTGTAVLRSGLERLRRNAGLAPG